MNRQNYSNFEKLSREEILKLVREYALEHVAAGFTSAEDFRVEEFYEHYNGYGKYRINFEAVTDDDVVSEYEDVVGF